MTKLNEIKIKLIKIDGVNLLFGKGVLETNKGMIKERKGLLFKDTVNYKSNTEHLKRDRKGKAFVFIDLKEHKSFNPHVSLIPNIKEQNALGYLMQEKNWKARQSNLKNSKWTILGYMFMGMGLMWFVQYLLGMVLGRI